MMKTINFTSAVCFWGKAKSSLKFLRASHKPFKQIASQYFISSELCLKLFFFFFYKVLSMHRLKNEHDEDQFTCKQ